MRIRYPVAAAPVLAAAALLAAGCGGGSKAPGIANIGTSTTDSSSSSGGSGSDGTKARNGAAFSSCMRAHGIRNFPDPSSSGNLEINPSMGINPDSATFQAAQKACQKKLDIKPPSAAEQARMQEQALKFSACMRAHGVPKFPDPTFSNGGMRVKIEAGSGIDPSSPQFQAAQKACQDLIPGAKTGHAPRGSNQSGGGTLAP
jgi:hypothetical protein